MLHTESILVRNGRYKNIRVFGLETLVEPLKIAVTTYAQMRTSISELIGVEYTKQVDDIPRSECDTSQRIGVPLVHPQRL